LVLVALVLHGARTVAWASPPPERVGVWSGAGSWPEGRRALIAAIASADLIAVPLGPGPLRAEDLHDLAAVVLPGGWAPEALAAIGAEGVGVLRDFVRRGGGCLAVCAGAYLVADDVRWEGERIPYPLDLFPGQAVGPLVELAPWPRRVGVQLRGVPGDHPLQGQGELRGCYLGGPALEPNSEVVPLLRYPDGRLAAAALRPGSGRLVVVGPHLEVGAAQGEEPSQAAAAFLRRVLRWVVASR
jgi:glutamine amidotransferase-like uncharacterized protein